jgi:asparagine synthase (glutamine-hydrolysing)
VCGIAGYYGSTSPELANELLSVMNSALAHRGPDGEGTWVGPGVGLGHRRLAIIDLQTGQQPMSAVNSRYHVVLNGEIYNHNDLRRELAAAGYTFATRSDTEVIPAALDHWGVSEGLLRLRGMFAFAMYDIETRSLLLARDRVGIKPLYIGRGGGLALFASEPKAILKTGQISGKANLSALMDFFSLGETLSPSTTWQSIQEVPPGTWIMFSSGGKESSACYWRWDSRAKRDYSEREAVEKLEEILTGSLKVHLESDVKVSTFLSGGIDSSLLVSLLCGKLNVKLDSFNVGFDEKGYDESPYARQVAEHCGARLHQLHIGDGEGDPDLFRAIVEQYDQPFGDSSAIPTYLICRKISRHGKVVISGDGGDEMFGGYSRYQHALDLARAGAISGAPTALAALAGLVSFVNADISRGLKKASSFAKLPRPAMLCALHTYFRDGELRSLLSPDFCAQLHDGERTLHRFALDVPSEIENAADQLMAAEIRLLLHADYLRKIDVASSAHGLEVRTPFLDSEVMNFASELSVDLKVTRRSPKHVLRLLARQWIPKSVIDRKKQGFGIPLDRWAGPRMVQFLNELLCGADARSSKLLRREEVAALMAAFTQRGGPRQLSRYQVYQRIFILAAFELWLRKWSPSLG